MYKFALASFFILVLPFQFIKRYIHFISSKWAFRRLTLIQIHVWMLNIYLMTWNTKHQHEYNKFSCSLRLYSLCCRITGLYPDGKGDFKRRIRMECKDPPEIQIPTAQKETRSCES